MLVYKRDLCVVIGGYRRAYADSYDKSGKYNCVAEPRQPDWLDSFHCSLFLACGMVFREMFQVEQTSFRDVRQTACDLPPPHGLCGLMRREVAEPILKMHRCETCVPARREILIV